MDVILLLLFSREVYLNFVYKTKNKKEYAFFIYEVDRFLCKRLYFLKVFYHYILYELFIAEQVHLLILITIKCHYHVVVVAHTAHYYIGCGNQRQITLNRKSYIGLFSLILSKLLHGCLIGSMPLRHKEARVG